MSRRRCREDASEAREDYANGPPRVVRQSSRPLAPKRSATSPDGGSCGKRMLLARSEASRRSSMLAGYGKGARAVRAGCDDESSHESKEARRHNKLVVLGMLTLRSQKPPPPLRRLCVRAARAGNAQRCLCLAYSQDRHRAQKATGSKLSHGDVCVCVWPPCRCGGATQATSAPA